MPTGHSRQGRGRKATACHNQQVGGTVGAFVRWPAALGESSFQSRAGGMGAAAPRRQGASAAGLTPPAPWQRRQGARRRRPAGAAPRPGRPQSLGGRRPRSGWPTCAPGSAPSWPPARQRSERASESRGRGGEGGAGCWQGAPLVARQPVPSGPASALTQRVVSKSGQVRRAACSRARSDRRRAWSRPRATACAQRRRGVR